jgi:hypothetical protein
MWIAGEMIEVEITRNLDAFKTVKTAGHGPRIGSNQ